MRDGNDTDHVIEVTPPIPDSFSPSIPEEGTPITEVNPLSLYPTDSARAAIVEAAGKKIFYLDEANVKILRDQLETHWTDIKKKLSEDEEQSFISMPLFEIERSAMLDDNVILNQNHVGNAIEFSMRQIGESISKLHGELKGCNEWVEHYKTKLNNSGEHPLDNQRQNRRKLQNKIAKAQNRLESAGEEKDRKECQHILNESQAKISTLDISIANAEYAEENAPEYEGTLEKCKDTRAKAKALLDQFKVAAGVEPYKLDDTKGVFVFSTSQFQNMSDATLARIPRDILTAEELRAYRMNDPEDLFGQVIELFDDCEIRAYDLSKDQSFEAGERWTESEELGRIRITLGRTRPAVHGYGILQGHHKFTNAYAFAKGHLGQDARVEVLGHYETKTMRRHPIGIMIPSVYALISYSFDTTGPQKTRYHVGGNSTTFTPITQSEALCSYCRQRGHTINQCGSVH